MMGDHSAYATAIDVGIDIGGAREFLWEGDSCGILTSETGRGKTRREIKYL